MQIILNKLQKKDLSFLLEVRNDNTTRNNLENDSIFSLEECEKWFKDTNPDWFIIINEDDYVFTQHNWDKYLVEKFQSLENCGYLSMVVTDKKSTYPKHASHSTGITSYEVLKKLFDKFGELPHSKDNNYGVNEHLGQVKQTNEIYNLGYELYDVKEDFKVLFLNYKKQIITYYKKNKEILIKPSHL